MTRSIILRELHLFLRCNWVVKKEERTLLLCHGSILWLRLTAYKCEAWVYIYDYDHNWIKWKSGVLVQNDTFLLFCQVKSSGFWSTLAHDKE